VFHALEYDALALHLYNVMGGGTFYRCTTGSRTWFFPVHPEFFYGCAEICDLDWRIFYHHKILGGSGFSNSLSIV